MVIRRTISGATSSGTVTPGTSPGGSSVVVVSGGSTSATPTYVTAVSKGPKGDKGDKGDRGDPAKGSYKHVQDIAADVWTITHGLDFVPNVAVCDSAGTVVVGAVSYVDADTIRVSFSVPFAGIAYCS